MTIDQAAEMFELTEVLDRELDKLSGGELQRVAMAATMMKDADVYFFDEPTSYLDIYQRVKMARLIKDLSVEKQVMVIEHDLDVIRSADYIVDMGPGGGEKGGRIVATGTPAQIKAAPASATGRFL